MNQLYTTKKTWAVVVGGHTLIVAGVLIGLYVGMRTTYTTIG